MDVTEVFPCVLVQQTIDFEARLDTRDGKVLIVNFSFILVWREIVPNKHEANTKQVPSVARATFKRNTPQMRSNQVKSNNSLFVCFR